MADEVAKWPAQPPPYGLEVHRVVGSAGDAALTTLRYFVSPTSGPAWAELAPATPSSGTSCAGSVSWRC